MCRHTPTHTSSILFHLLPGTQYRTTHGRPNPRSPMTCRVRRPPAPPENFVSGGGEVQHQPGSPEHLHRRQVHNSYRRGRGLLIGSNYIRPNRAPIQSIETFTWHPPMECTLPMESPRSPPPLTRSPPPKGSPTCMRSSQLMGSPPPIESPKPMGMLQLTQPEPQGSRHRMRSPQHPNSPLDRSSVGGELRPSLGAVSKPSGEGRDRFSFDRESNPLSPAKTPRRARKHE